MDTKAFIIATNGHLKWRLHHTLEDLSPEQLGYRTPLINDRPIAEVAMHATVILLGTATVAAMLVVLQGYVPLAAFLFRQDTDDTGSRREPSRRPGKIVTRLQRLVLRAAL